MISVQKLRIVLLKSKGSLVFKSFMVLKSASHFDFVGTKSLLSIFNMSMFIVTGF